MKMRSSWKTIPRPRRPNSSSVVARHPSGL
jgi:hypothetical protein